MAWSSLFTLDPITRRRFKRFRQIKRGYYSFVLLLLLYGLSLVAELFINSRALIVSYDNKLYFPTYGSIYPGKAFGLDYEYETNYRQLKKHFTDTQSNNWVILPLVPYNPYENDLPDGVYPPTAPSWADQHYLGTDSTGRDIVARLIYAFRISMTFALVLVLCNYMIGVSLGSMMGYFGGKFDLIMQRIIEIWSNVPFLYVVMIMASLMVPSFGSMVLIMLFFGWMHMTWYMRTATYKEKARDYTLAAESLGAGAHRIVFRHIIPNAISTIVTFIPFSVEAAISSLTALDYLGYGLPPPTPSWGELIFQGSDHLDKEWILLSVIFSMILVLTLVTFIGEAIREAFDPRKFTFYE